MQALALANRVFELINIKITELISQLRSSDVPREALTALKAWDALQMQVCNLGKTRASSTYNSNGLLWVCFFDSSKQ